MFGCFRRLGCLVILVVLGVLAWFNRDRLEAIYRRYAGGPPAADTASMIRLPGGWEPLTADKATRGQRGVESLSRRSGPVFVNLTAGEAASYIFLAVAKQLPASSQDISSSVKGDRLYVRANVALRDFGGTRVLGPLGALLGERDTVQLGGTINVLRPGVGEFQVKTVRVGAFPVPSAIIPRLVRRIRKGPMPEGLAADALPMKLPAYIGDVRIANGRITVYKNTQ
ncbi:MAG: hypothetical protein Q7S20_02745 [Gemmatimonadaceae bacterium]|nr:hypothetical protein [Gemmatimonadaceae bacterium]